MTPDNPELLQSHFQRAQEQIKDTERKREETKIALRNLYDFLGCAKKGTTITRQDVARLYKEKQFPYDDSRVTYFFENDFDSALKASGLPTQKELAQAAKTKAEQEQKFTKADIENWVKNFIKSNHKAPRLVNDIKPATANNQLPDLNSIAKICGQNMTKVVNRIWIQKELGKL